MDSKNNPRFMLLVIFTCISLTFYLSLAADKISASQSLSGNQTIISAGGSFELGFFKPGNSSNYYIGIWYNKVSLQTVVWVANREKPVSDIYSSELRISRSNLVLLNESKFSIWSTDLNSTPSSSAEAILLDEGNLVLRDGPNSSDPLWQSFDHPVNTWLPGSKLGYNKITKKSTLLNSWKSKEDPAPGLFSTKLDPNQTQFISLWNLTRQYWNSGTWSGWTFNLLPGSTSDYVLNRSYVSNNNESYFIYAPQNNSIISQFVLDVGGQIQQRSWSEQTRQWNVFWSLPVSQCGVYGYCGAFGVCRVKSEPVCHCLRGFEPKSIFDYNLTVYSGGCIRRTNLHCENSSLIDKKNNDKFFGSYSVVLPPNAQKVNGKTAAECESVCFNYCPCTAYAYENDQCQIWTGDLMNLEQIADGSMHSGKTLHVKLAASEFTNAKDKKEIVITLAVISIGLGLLLGLVYMVLMRKKRNMKMSKVADGSLTCFTYRDLVKATKNFSEKLGGGGFGSVFKGMLPNSSIIAVKKLESISQGEKQFRTEVRTIGTIQHVNLVRLRGFCSQGTRKLLVYDYMPYGSLSSHLFHGNHCSVLDWKQRYKIAQGIARGLAYLHEKCRECIIHCDIKPDNILLDADFCPKISDFGLAKLFGHDFSRVLTTIRGTIGYLAPEWISGMAITTKSDVYSFGMMLFEIVSGRRNSEHHENETMCYFPILAGSILNKDGNVLSIIDPRLEREADVKEVIRVLKIALWCIQEDEGQRPSMGHVVNVLEGVIDVDLPGMPRLFQQLVGYDQDLVSSSAEVEFTSLQYTAN